MSFNFRVTVRFERSVKNLKRRFPKITQDLAQAFQHIEDNPQLGTIIPNDYSIRKLRVASSDMQRGKSGGFRLLYKLSSDDDDEVDEDELFATMLFVYAKADQSDVTASFLEILDEDINGDDDTD